MPQRLPSLPFQPSRIRLRLLRRQDLHAFLLYRNDADVARFQGWSPMSQAEAKAFIEQYDSLDSLTPGTWSQLAIAAVSDDTLIGDVGLWLSPGASEAEFGLTIAPEYQGQGLGTETVRGIIDFLFQIETIGSIVASTDVRNTPCLRALAAAGMQKVGSNVAEYKGELCHEHRFRIGRPDA